MRDTFKIYQYYISKVDHNSLSKTGAEGFTLIELLVSIIIIGVLATIALPSFLNLTAKARGSEARANLGAINRAQQTYRFEAKSFANSVGQLEQGGMTIVAKKYNYTIAGGEYTASAEADPVEANLKVYAAGIAQGVDDTLRTVICESKNIKEDASENTASVSLSSSPTAIATCAVGKQLD